MVSALHSFVMFSFSKCNIHVKFLNWYSRSCVPQISDSEHVLFDS